MKKAFIIIGSIVAGIMVLSFALCTFGFLVSESDKTKDKQDTVKFESKKTDKADQIKTEAPKENKVTAKQLIKEFEDNEVKANKKYKDKKIKITGEVATIGQNSSDTYIHLTSGKILGLTNITCNLKNTEDGKAEKLNKGDNVAVVGIVKEMIWNITVNECELR
jgi:uncharacterized membrane protein YdfJ with MMPL/SSD domain